jgi:Tfp pilus assembly protein PilE
MSVAGVRSLAVAARTALTMVELLIVMVVIAILVGSILAASSTFLNKSRTNNTQAVLNVVADAIEQFKRDQTAKPTITAWRYVPPPPDLPVKYSDRYGLYPPDELEVFTLAGVPGCKGAACISLAVGGAAVAPPLATGSKYEPMKFYTAGNPKPELEHRDLAAMIVTLELLNEAATSILDRLPDRNRTAGALGSDGKPSLFLERSKDKDGKWDPRGDDHQIRYIVDDWGVPISYLAQRDFDPKKPLVASSNHPDWNEASTELIRLNSGQPILFSYGPNGPDQLTKDAMEPVAGDVAKTSLVGDFENNDDHVVNDPFNDDNVYANPALKEKLAKGIATP